jgi:hypothetical protein
MLQRLPEGERDKKQAPPQFDKTRSRVFRREKQADPVNKAIQGQLDSQKPLKRATPDLPEASSGTPMPKVKPPKASSPEKKMVPPEKKIEIKEPEKISDRHMEYLVQNFGEFQKQPMFYVTPKQPSETMTRKLIYPVFHIETMPVKHEQHEDMDEAKRKDMMNDIDDDEVLQAKEENAVPVMLTIVWLLVGDSRNNRLLWVDSSEVYYL